MAARVMDDRNSVTSFKPKKSVTGIPKYGSYAVVTWYEKN